MSTMPIVVTEAMYLWPYKQEVPSSSLGAPTTQTVDPQCFQGGKSACLDQKEGTQESPWRDFSDIESFRGPILDVGKIGGRTHIQLSCLCCGKPLWARPVKVRKGQGRFCSRSCTTKGRDRTGFRSSGRSRFGADNPSWKGGFKAIDHVRKFKAANPEKVRVQQIVRQAIRSGKLARPAACSQCGAACKPDAHHSDYSRPLDVTWVCRKCHVDIHHTGKPRGKAL